jgi:hypothetical protein
MLIFLYQVQKVQFESLRQMSTSGLCGTDQFRVSNPSHRRSPGMSDRCLEYQPIGRDLGVNFDGCCLLGTRLTIQGP